MTVGLVALWGHVYPTGAIGPAARQDVVGVYRGILASPPGAPGLLIRSNRNRLFPILFGLVGAATERAPREMQE